MILTVNKSNDDLQGILRPMVSLISKSEKAQQKLAPGSWQHTMLRDNLRALRLALELMTGEAIGSARVAPDDIREALRALASMISKTRKAQATFKDGTSQHTLLRNRLKALRAAEKLVKAEVVRGKGTEAQRHIGKEGAESIRHPKSDIRNSSPSLRKKHGHR